MFGIFDMTYCVSPNCTNKCLRKLTKEISERAEKEGYWLSVSYFCGSPEGEENGSSE